MNDNELMHYGVLGMKWGHRKKYYNKDGSLNTTGRQREITRKYKADRRNASSRSDKKKLREQYEKDINSTYNKKYKKKDLAYDNFKLGTRGRNRINDRMNNGESYAKASIKEYARSYAKGVAATAALLASPYIANKAANSLGKYVTEKSIQKANKGLARIGTMKLKHVAGDVYEYVMK